MSNTGTADSSFESAGRKKHGAASILRSHAADEADSDQRAEQMIRYRRNYPLNPSDIVRVFESSGIQRPTTDLRRITHMFQNANLVLSAWAGRRLVGVCRALTDFSYCCYLSDLAVEREFQKRGIGRTLIDRLRSVIGEEVTLIVVSAPSTVDYYPNVGFEPIQNGYIITRQR